MVITGGLLGSHKGVSAPGAHLSLSALSEKDRDDAHFAVEQRLDFLALSFIVVLFTANPDLQIE